MVRKTIALNDELFKTLELSKLTEKYQSFSELVSNAITLLIEKQQKEQYKKDMIQASKDPLYKSDMKEVNSDFSYSDNEVL